MAKTAWLVVLCPWLTVCPVLADLTVNFDDPLPSGNVVTSNPGPFQGPDVATLIGANTFYSAGYSGAGTIVTNVEAGLIWSGHETLGHVTNDIAFTGVPGGSFATPAYDRHATWVGSMIGGRGTDPYQLGIAYNTDLRSAAIATGWSSPAYATGFSTNTQSIRYAYEHAFGTADVVNSSWGATSSDNSTQAGGNDSIALIVDGLAYENRFTTFVVSAGNSGQGNNKVGSPGSGYNGITVAALSNVNNVYNTLASFSSGGAMDYRGPGGVLVQAGTAQRVAVDIAAPGDTLMAAYYGGQTGGNDASLKNSAASGGPDYYAYGLAGTSFSAPIVAGGVTLMHQAAAAQIASVNGEDTRVIKANLLNAATKTSGWTNGQTVVNGVITTTQALDFNTGAGAMNLTRTYTQFLSGQKDITGSTGGATANTVGWDFGTVGLGGHNDITINVGMLGGSEFRATLTWFRERDYDYGANSSTPLTTDPTDADDLGYANLDLQVWNSSFTTLIAQSISQYTEVEHLTFNLPGSGLYGLRVLYAGNVFGSQTSEDYAIAWAGSAVPEPGTVAVLIGATMILLKRRRKPLAL